MASPVSGHPIKRTAPFLEVLNHDVSFYKVDPDPLCFYKVYKVFVIYTVFLGVGF